MLSYRALASLSQYLEEQPRETVELLFSKHGVWEEGAEFGSYSYDAKTIQAVLSQAKPEAIDAALTEIASTPGSMRRRASPKYVYDERERDLTVCLALDGYIVHQGQLMKTEPELEGAAPLEDDLTRELNRSNLAASGEILRLLNSSAEDFLKSPADLNGALSNARVALQTLASSISAVHAESRPAGFDDTKWGQVIAHLRKAGVVSKEEETGIAGVFTFVSPGTHSYVGLSKVEMVRLGRSLVVSMCYFLIKRHNG